MYHHCSIIYVLIFKGDCSLFVDCKYSSHSRWQCPSFVENWDTSYLMSVTYWFFFLYHLDLLYVFIALQSFLVWCTKIRLCFFVFRQRIFESDILLFYLFICLFVFIIATQYQPVSIFHVVLLIHYKLMFWRNSI